MANRDSSSCFVWPQPVRDAHSSAASRKQTVGQAGDLHAEGLKQPGDIQGGGLALGVRVGGHDDLVDAALGHTVQQRLDVQVVGPHVVHGGQYAVEHVIAAAVLPAALDGDDIPGVGHHAYRGVVPLLIGAYRAQPPSGEILAHRAQGDAALGIGNGVGEGLCLLRGQGQYVKGQPLGGLIAHARQTGELLH